MACKNPSSEIQFITVDAKPGGRKMTKWQRSAGFNIETKDVFVPAAIAGDEKKIGFCASHDGESFVIMYDHFFVRSAWMKREFPETTDVCEKIESRVLTAFSSEDGSEEGDSEASATTERSRQ